VTARPGGLDRWRGVIPDDELEVFRAAGETERVPIGGRVALLVVDVTYDFTGDKGDEHLASIAKFRASCGPYAWNAIPAIARLLAAARAVSLPTIYTRGSRVPNATAGHAWSRTGGVRTLRLRTPESRERGSEFPAEIAPLPSDTVIEKTKASAFFGTPLEAHLVDLGIDHVLIAGCTTSGCVRATVLDASYRNFGVTVVEEAVFDRSLTSHRVNLFEIDRKYASVTPIAEVLEALANLSTGPDRRLS
jgi:maleamate amidohydrolase